MSEPPAPSSPATPPQEPPAGAARRRRRVLGVIVQLAGFGVCMALLVWCVRLAFSEKNRAALEQLRDASATDLALLLGLSALSLTLNGLIFWVSLRPVKRLPPLDLVAANNLATFLNYLPFKIGAIFRLVIHTRRDGIPLLTVTSWLAGVVLVIAAVLAPIAAASIWRKGLDALWIVTVCAGVALSFVLLWRTAVIFAGAKGLARLHRLTAGIGPVAQLTRSALFHHLHAGFSLLAFPAALGGSYALRLLDTSVQAARFLVAAQILGQKVSIETAVIFASTYFLIGVLSPSGFLGAREGGTTGLAKLLAVPGSESFALVALLITAGEMLVNLAGAVFGIAWLRPDRLLKLRHARAAPP